jgi:hypothetical protein
MQFGLIFWLGTRDTAVVPERVAMAIQKPNPSSLFCLRNPLYAGNPRQSERRLESVYAERDSTP